MTAMNNTAKWRIFALSMIGIVTCAAAPLPAQPRHNLRHKHQTRIATVAMLRHRLKIGMNGPAVERALRGLTFLPGGEAVVQAGSSGSSVELDSYLCRDGKVWVGYSRRLYGQKPETATVVSIGGPHFFTGDASAMP